MIRSARLWKVAGLLVLSGCLLEAVLRVRQRVEHESVPADASELFDYRNPVRFFERVEVAGESIYRRTAEQPLVVRGTHFAAPRPADGLRVFLVGSSAAAGWPHNEELNGYTVSALLAQKLRKLLPQRTIEVINACGSTYGSHRVRLIFNEIIEYQPDLVLLNVANNEFVEPFVFRPRRLPAVVLRSAMGRALERGIERISPSPRPVVDIQGYSEASTVASRVSLVFGQPSKFTQDPELFRQMVERYRLNVTAMVRECKRRNIPILLLNVPVNLKDWLPNVSTHRADLSEASRELWQSSFREGFLALEAGRLDVAVERLAEAARIDDAYAEGHYHLGAALHKLGKISEARAEYVKALERDAFPYRELPVFARTLEAIALAEAVPIVDSVGLLEQHARDGIPGLDAFVDHVHFTGQSQEVIAQGVLAAMVREKILPDALAAGLDDARITVPPAAEERTLSHGLVSMLRAALLFRQHDKIEQLNDRVLLALRLRMATAAGQPDQDASNLEFAQRVRGVILPYAKLLRAEKLGLVSAQFSDQEAREVFDNYVKLIQVIEGQYMSWADFMAAVPRFVEGQGSAPVAAP